MRSTSPTAPTTPPRTPPDHRRVHLPQEKGPGALCGRTRGKPPKFGKPPGHKGPEPVADCMMCLRRYRAHHRGPRQLLRQVVQSLRPFAPGGEATVDLGTSNTAVTILKQGGADSGIRLRGDRSRTWAELEMDGILFRARGPIEDVQPKEGAHA